MGLTPQDYLILTAIFGFLLALIKMVEKFGTSLLARYRNGKQNPTDSGGNPHTTPEPSIEWLNTAKCLENRNKVIGEVNGITKEALDKVSEKTSKVHDRLDEVKDSVGAVEKIMIRLEGKVETTILQNQMLIQKEVNNWGKDHLHQFHRQRSSVGKPDRG